MKVFVNGSEKKILSSTTISELIGSLKINSQNVLIEVNREVVVKRDYSATVLKEGDEIELIRFVGGG